METSLKTGFAAPLAPPARTPMIPGNLHIYVHITIPKKTETLITEKNIGIIWKCSY